MSHGDRRDILSLHDDARPAHVRVIAGVGLAWILALVAAPASALFITDRVKISEVCYDPGENPELPYEFVELYNAGNAVAYLDGAVISDQGNNGTNEATFQFPGAPLIGTTIPLAPGEFMLLSVSSLGSPYPGIRFEFFGGAPDIDDPLVPNLEKTSGLASDLGLANTGDGITLSVGISNGNVIPCNEVVDGVSWKDGGGPGELNATSRTMCVDPAAHPGTPNGPYSIQRKTNGNDTDRSADDFVVAARTPGAAAPCLLDPKCVRDLTYSPCVPLANQAVTVSLHVSGGSYSSIRTLYKLEAAASFDSVAMVPGPDTTFVATVPGQPNLSRVQYWCRVIDSAGDTIVLPPGAPGVTLDYRVGIVPISTIQGTVVADTCGSSTYAGKAVNVRGVVTHEAAEFDLQSFFIQRGTAPFSGIRVHVPDTPFFPQFHDSVQVAGTVQEVDCETRIVMFSKCGQVLAIDRRVKPRQLVAVSDIAAEANEGMLVTVPGPIPVISGFDTTGTDYEFQIGTPGNTAWVGGDTFSPDNVGYSIVPAPGQILDAVTGIVAVRHPNAFDTTTRLRLEPRRDNDVDRDYTDAGDPETLHVVHAFRLGTNVPNPFNPHTTIEYVVPETSDTRIEIYDAHGARVRQLVSRQALPAGSYRATWDGTDDAGHGVASGLYIARLYAGQRSASRKMLLLR